MSKIVPILIAELIVKSIIEELVASSGKRVAGSIKAASMVMHRGVMVDTKAPWRPKTSHGGKGR